MNYDLNIFMILSHCMIRLDEKKFTKKRFRNLTKIIYIFPIFYFPILIFPLSFQYFIPKINTNIFTFKYSQGQVSIGKRVLRTLSTNCVLCNISKRYNTIYSSSRDLILTATSIDRPGLFYLLRSIRSIGCLATIIILTNNPSFKIPEAFSCGAQIYLIKTPTSRDLASVYKSRWEWYYEFLNLTWVQSSFDRIMHLDAFDTIFFSDPFSIFDKKYHQKMNKNKKKNIYLYKNKNGDSKNEIYFQSEEIHIKLCPYNRKWVKCHSSEKFQIIRNEYVLCSGSLIGHIKPFTTMIELMVTSEEWPACWGRGFDQGIFNIVFYTSFQSLNFNFSVYHMCCSSGFITMNYCSIDKTLQSLKESNPIFLHQYNRYINVTNYVQDICPENYSDI